MLMQPNIILSRPHLSLFPSFYVIITGSYRLHRLAFYVEFHTRARLGQVYKTQVRTCMEKQPRSTFIFYSEELLYTAFIYRSLTVIDYNICTLFRGLRAGKLCHASLSGKAEFSSVKPYCISVRCLVGQTTSKSISIMKKRLCQPITIP